MSIQKLVDAQKQYFETEKTISLSFRVNALKKLHGELTLRVPDAEQAIYSDLGKAAQESYLSEIGIVLDEIRFMLKHLPKWVKDKRVRTPFSSFPSKSFVRHDPYGVVLIMAPWNYPLLLSLAPLVGAIAAGNCAVLKPSEYAPATSRFLCKLIENCFPPEYVAVVEGGLRESSALLDIRFDYIFFTGSVEVGKIVMEKAARNLTPVSLELGGKSPCIVDKTANVELAGRRIAFGKFLNAGQTCVAPDYLLVDKQVKEPLVTAIKKATTEFFGEDPLQSEELPKIVNKKHFNRLIKLMEGQHLLMGGGYDGHLRIAPTILGDVLPESPVMQEEIFGPILPVLTYDNIEEAIYFINGREKPLALYLFSQDTSVQKQILRRCRFGGGCINDTIMHVASSYLGFGGVGNSGMGSYHGKKSFDTFTHDKSIIKRGEIDIKIRYHPYTPSKYKIIRKILK